MTEQVEPIKKRGSEENKNGRITTYLRIVSLAGVIVAVAGMSTEWYQWRGYIERQVMENEVQLRLRPEEVRERISEHARTPHPGTLTRSALQTALAEMRHQIKDDIDKAIKADNRAQGQK